MFLSSEIVTECLINHIIHHSLHYYHNILLIPFHYAAFVPLYPHFPHYFPLLHSLTIHNPALLEHFVALHHQALHLVRKLRGGWPFEVYVLCEVG